MLRIKHVAATSVAICIALLLAPAAVAAVVNVDFFEFGSDATHSGADGIMSGSGTLWNAVDFSAPSSDISDEDGNGTAVDVVPTAFFSGLTDGASTNDLQDSGLNGNGFNIADLKAGGSYAIAFYGGLNMGFQLDHAGGSFAGPCTGPPTFILPGTVGRDYCRFTNLQPIDLGGGVYGFRLTFLDGLITGFQIAGDFSTPGVPALGPRGIALLVLALGAAPALSMWRRRTPQ